MIGILTKRQVRVLQLLCKSKFGYTSNYLSEVLSVSTRTIRTDINVINTYLNKFDCTVKASKKSGYYLELSENDKVNDVLSSLISQTNSELPSISIERQYFLLSKVMFSKKVNLISFSNSIFVSLQTVLKDIEKLRKTIETKYSLNLIEVKGNYLFLKQDEYAIRQLFFMITKHEIAFSDELICENLKFLIGEHLNISKLKSIKKYINDFYTLKKYTLSDDSLFLITWIVYFTTFRGDYKFELKSDTKSSTKYKYNQIVTELVEYITLEKRIVLSEVEKEMLMKYLDTVGLLNINKTIHIVLDETQQVVKEFKDLIFDIYGIDLTKNLEFLESMIIHIDGMIKRNYTNYQLINPTLDLIKLNYPFSYNIETLISPIIYRLTNSPISDDVLGNP